MEHADLRYAEQVLIPLTFIVLAIGGPITLWIVRRAFDHRERMAMIARGMAPPQFAAFEDECRGQRGWGRRRFGHGSPQQALQRGISLFFVGAALLIGLSFVGYRTHDGVTDLHLGPWLLGGLVPMFVGIANIVNALLSGVGSPMPGASPWSTPPPTPGPGPAPTGPPPWGPYTYRPGNRPELKGPFQPPDRS
ncbi:MAG TPA: DUF6249 domain-containing protein [Candidatus Acidoferrales bacterium]|nr:DUF6249 domain-containing protein [Candidatus Acidoferrales bacterium]